MVATAIFGCMPKDTPNPDHLLAPEQFPELNRAFYATKPWAYFNYRNHLLMLAAGAWKAIRRAPASRARQARSAKAARFCSSSFAQATIPPAWLLVFFGASLV